MKKIDEMVRRAFTAGAPGKTVLSDSNEQKGLINLDDIVDILREVGNIHNYLENAALRILLFGNPELNFYQCRLLVLKYGESLSQDDLHGRMVFIRMIQLLEANTV